MSWTAVSNASKYRVEYRQRGELDWIVDDDTLTMTSHTVDGLTCGLEYQFRLSGYGSGTVYAEEWSDTSAPLTTSSGDCPPAEFGQESYSFAVTDEAVVDDVVGRVSATGSEGDAVTYSITAGNGDGFFSIDRESGEIKVASSLNGESGSTVTLTVQAEDANRGSATVEVTISIILGCSGGTAVSNPTTNTGLLGDCNALLRSRNSLAGTATLNWDINTGIGSWDGVTLGGTPQRVTGLSLISERLTGVVPQALGDLSELERLELNANSLAGEIPAELGKLDELQALHLDGNDLTGEIPAELGNLTNLSELYLSNNRLTGRIPKELGNLGQLTLLILEVNRLEGSIPPELGNLSRLEWLWLRTNDLTGAVPASLADLTNLTHLLLDGNNLMGCVPLSLKSVATNDLNDAGLTDCQPGPAAPTGLSVSITDGVFSAGWSSVSNTNNYEVQYRTGGAAGTWASAGTSTTTSLDYSPTGGPVCDTTYDFRVRAHGDGITFAAGWGTASVAVSVDTPACNQGPVFNPASYTFAVAEDASVGDNVGAVTANDSDTGDTLAFSITAGNGDGKFSIDDGTGEITVAAALDYETATSYTLSVQVDDGNNGTDTATVTVNVSNVADTLPPAPTGVNASLVGGNFTVTWTTVSGTNNYEVQYRTGGNAGTWGSAGTSTSDTFDYSPTGGPDCGTTYDFRVRAHGDGTDHTADWGDESSEISILSEACATPEFSTTTYTLKVAEDASVGDDVGTVKATDANASDTLTYSITAGNGDGKFTIDDGTGEITVAATLDYETTPSYTLTVQVDDGTMRTDTATVTVNVTNVADTLPPAPTGVSASLAGGTFTVTWTAVSGADNYEVQFRTGGATTDWTSVGATTSTSLDFTPTGNLECGGYDFRVRAHGDGTTHTADWGVESDEASVDTETCATPEFSTTTYTFIVAENASVGDDVETVTATDANAGETLAYSITAGNGDGKFTIDDGTGEISVAAALDHETTPSYTLTVQIDDGTMRTDTATVTINVTNVADTLPPAPAVVNGSRLFFTFTIGWTAVSGADNYEVQVRTGGDTDTWTTAGTTANTTLQYRPSPFPTCDVTLDFRVRAHGDGADYLADWGPVSIVKSVDTHECQVAPEFGAEAYSFTLPDDAEVDDAVGTVTATDDNTDDLLSYSITEGNDDGKFAIDRETGEITVNASLDYETTPVYTLTVKATDGGVVMEGIDSATVTISLTLAECSNGTVVSSPADNPKLVRDCSILLAAEDTLKGDGALNWSEDLVMSSWDGVTLEPGSDTFVKSLVLDTKGLTGSIPASFGGMAELERLDLDDNQLTGGIPSELGNLSNLVHLNLFDNQLTGAIPSELGLLSRLSTMRLYDNMLSDGIPTELGNLDNLTTLILDNNRLTGSIPAELGNMTSLEWLWLRDNQLTGEIPEELEDLSNLSNLFLTGNTFTGCIPSGLDDVQNHDLDQLSIDFCS